MWYLNGFFQALFRKKRKITIFEKFSFEVVEAISVKFQQNFNKISAKFPQKFSKRVSSILKIEILFSIWSSIVRKFDEFFKNQDFLILFGIKFKISQISDDQLSLTLNRGFTDEFYEGHFQSSGHLDFVYFTEIEWMKSAGFKNVILIFLFCGFEMIWMIDHVELEKKLEIISFVKNLDSYAIIRQNLVRITNSRIWYYVSVFDPCYMKSFKNALFFQKP